jgi:hypothetical protein
MDQHEAVAMLRREFGLGELPQARMRFYLRVGWAVQRHPKAAAIVQAALVESRGMTTPARWFCRTVSFRLAEARIWPVHPKLKELLVNFAEQTKIP